MHNEGTVILGGGISVVSIIEYVSIIDIGVFRSQDFLTFIFFSYHQSDSTVFSL